ncbi:MAG: carboxypeptidase regulatory-like domain-containing protein [bacterium]
MDFDYKDELDKKIIRTSKGARSRWGVFAPMHNFLRRNFRWYHNWHSKDYSRLVHILVLIVYLIGYSAIALLIGLNLLTQYGRTKAAVYNETFTGTQYGEDYKDYYYQGGWQEGETSALWDSKTGELRLRDRGDGNLVDGHERIVAWNPHMAVDNSNTYAYVGFQSKVYENENGDIYLQKVNISTGEIQWSQSVAVVYDGYNVFSLRDLDYVHIEATGEDYVFLASTYQGGGTATGQLEIINVSGASPVVEGQQSLSQSHEVNGVQLYIAGDIEGEINEDIAGGNVFYHVVFDLSAPGGAKKLFYNRFCADKDAGAGGHCPAGGAVGAIDTVFGTRVYPTAPGAPGGNILISGDDLGYRDGPGVLEVEGRYLYGAYSKHVTSGPWEDYRVIVAQKGNWFNWDINETWGEEPGFVGSGARLVSKYYGYTGTEEKQKYIQDVVAKSNSTDGSDADLYVFWYWNQKKIYGQKIVGENSNINGLVFGWDGGHISGNYNDELLISKSYNSGDPSYKWRGGVTGTIVEDVGGFGTDDYIFATWYSNFNAAADNFEEEDIYAQRITLNNCQESAENCEYYQDGDIPWFWEGASENPEENRTNVRAGNVNADAMDTIVISYEGKQYIYGAFMLGFMHKDGIRDGDDSTQHWYAETRTQGFDVASTTPDTATYYDDPGGKFVSFIGYEEDKAVNSGNYYDSAGTLLDFAINLSDYDGSVTSRNINTLGKVYSINLSPTHDTTPVNSDLKYFVSRTGNTWQEIDTFNTPFLIGPGKDLEYTGNGNDLYYQIFLKSGNLLDINNTPTVESLYITYFSDQEAPTSTLGALNDCYNSEFAITATAADTGGSGVAYTDLYYSYDGGDFVPLQLKLPGANPSWTCTPQAGVGEWKCDVTGGNGIYAVDLPGDGTYGIAACAVDNAGNEECSDPSEIVAEDTTTLDTQEPEVSFTDPSNGIGNVPLDYPVYIYFDDLPSATGGMDTTTIKATTLTITATNPAGPQITISDFVWSNGDLNLAVQHAGDNFVPGVEYTVQILDGVTDKCGNELKDESAGPEPDGILYEFTFTADNGAYIDADMLITDTDETLVTDSTSDPEERLTYTIRLQNIGENDATVLPMVDELPSDYVDYVAGSASHGGVYNVGPPPTIIWLNPIAVGAGSSVDVTFQVDIKSNAELPAGDTLIFKNIATGTFRDDITTRAYPFASSRATTTIIRDSDLNNSKFSVVDSDETKTAPDDGNPAENTTLGGDEFVYKIKVENTGHGTSYANTINTLPNVGGQLIGGFNFNEDSICEWDEALEKCIEVEGGTVIPDPGEPPTIGDPDPAQLEKLKGIFSYQEPKLMWVGILAPTENVIIRYTADIENPDDFLNDVDITGSDPVDLGINTNIASVPDMTSAVAADDGNNCASEIHPAQAGDIVTLSFNNPTNQYGVTPANIDTVLSLSNGHSWGGASGSWSDSQTLVITFSDGTGTIDINDSISIASSTIQDPTSSVDASGSPPAITGTFGEPCAGPVYYLRFMSAPTSVLINEWSDMIIVATTDAAGNEVDFTGIFGSIPVQLTSNSSTERFKDIFGSEGGDGFEVSIAAGSTRTYFYYKDSTVGTFTMTAAETCPYRSIEPGTQDITVYLVEPEYKLVFTTSVQTIKVNEMSEVMRVQLQKDGEGVPVGSNTTLDLTKSSAGGKFYSDGEGDNEINSVQILAGQSTSQDFYYSDSLTGYVIVYADENPSQDWYRASQRETIWSKTDPPPDKKRGCTDLEALNYDPDAVIDDGSCEYEGDGRGPSIFDPFSNFFQVILDFLRDSFKDAFSAIKFLALALALLDYLLFFRFFNFLIYLLYLLNYILEAMSEKKQRRAWGQVYNAVNKQPVDVALVRLFEVKDGEKKLLATKVTDREGRFGFAAEPGKYLIEVTKQGFGFPSKLIPKGFLKDDIYTDLYHGDELKMDPTNVDRKTGELKLAVNIPVDPMTDEQIRQKVLGEAYVYGVWLNFWYWTRINLKKIVIPLLLIAFAMNAYSLWQNQYLIDLIFMIITALILIKEFRDLIGRPTYGMVYDAKTKAPIANALVQILDAGHKTRARALTDHGGHYYFLVPKGKYQLKVSKPGFVFPSKLVKTKNDPPYHYVYSKGEIVMKIGGVIIANIPIDGT